jgi:hypothetical protein
MTRRRDIGNLGEEWTRELLEKAGFENITDLNLVRYNHPGADFLAERDGSRFFITVKARNKFREGTAKKLNGSYNIFPDKVRKHAEPYAAIPAWLTIQVDVERRCYSAYFGTIDSLRNRSGVGVPMTERAVEAYECLARDICDERITDSILNRKGN